MNKKYISYIKRLAHTAWQAGAAAAVVAIGTAGSMSEVNWVAVFNVAVLAAILSLIKSTITGTPEGRGNGVKKDE